MKRDLVLFYLARKSEGLEAFRRFVLSYLAHPAGCDHTLAVIYKGFETKAHLSGAHAEFADIPHECIFVSDTHYDIGAYLQGAAQVESDYVCFVNTHTKVLADNWLLHLRSAMRDSSIGLAGASASLESLYDSLAVTSKAVWLAGIEQIPYDHRLAEHYRFVLEPHAPNWLGEKRGNGQLWFKHGQFYHRYIEERWNTYWHSVCAPGGGFNFLDGFPRFPNPHVRSNGFILERKALLDAFKEIAPTKTAAYSFESGPDSLSARTLKSGEQLALVDCHGTVYTPDKWPVSKTFRLGDQSNLMLSDNQTRKFEKFSDAERATHVMMSWGDSLENPVIAYPLGFIFKVRRAALTEKWATSETPHIADHLTYGVPHARFVLHDPYVPNPYAWP